MADRCLVCGARRAWIKNSKQGGAMPLQIDDHKQAAEINAMIEDEKIARMQEREQVAVEAVVPKRRRKKSD